MQVLLDTKKEYIEHLIDVFSTPLAKKIYKIYNDVDMNISQFQKELVNIKNWNNNRIKDEYNELVKKTKCKYLDKLLEKIIIIDIKLKIDLSKTRISKRDLDIIKPYDFIHKCLINISIYCWKNVYLFATKNLKPSEKQYHLNLIEKNIKRIIKNTIRDIIPFEKIFELSSPPSSPEPIKKRNNPKKLEPVISNSSEDESESQSEAQSEAESESESEEESDTQNEAKVHNEIISNNELLNKPEIIDNLEEEEESEQENEIISNNEPLNKPEIINNLEEEKESEKENEIISNNESLNKPEVIDNSESEKAINEVITEMQSETLNKPKNEIQSESEDETQSEAEDNDFIDPTNFKGITKKKKAIDIISDIESSTDDSEEDESSNDDENIKKININVNNMAAKRNRYYS